MKALSVLGLIRIGRNHDIRFSNWWTPKGEGFKEACAENAYLMLSVEKLNSLMSIKLGFSGSSRNE